MARTGQSCDLQQAVPGSVRHRRGTGRHTELGERVCDMPMYGVLADEQALGDCLIAEAI